MAEKLRWGILATGRIAQQFAKGLKASRTGELVAVGSRTIEAATSFAAEHGGKPYARYEELLADPEVDVVYIATPHHLHRENTIAVARAGKGVLCEKPFTLNPRDTEEALEECRKANAFFMEAFMYRCHPQTLKAVELVRSGALGDVTVIAAEFGFNASREWDNFRLQGALGGGALMDVGTYCVSFSRLIAAEEPVRCEYLPKLAKNGYDEAGCGALLFANGVSAHFGTAVHQQLENKARIYGTQGTLEIDAPWKCFGAMRLLREDRVIEEWDLSSTNEELYAFEADAVAEYFEEKECPHMTWSDTVGNSIALDALRVSGGMRFGL